MARWWIGSAVESSIFEPIHPQPDSNARTDNDHNSRSLLLNRLSYEAMSKNLDILWSKSYWMVAQVTKSRLDQP